MIALNSLNLKTLNSSMAYDSYGCVVIGDELFIGVYQVSKSIYVYDANTYAYKRALNNSSYYLNLGTDGTKLYIKNGSNQILEINKTTGVTVATKTNVTFAEAQANFRIDIANDLLYMPNGANLNIYKYSTGVLLKTYTVPCVGVEVISGKYVIAVGNKKINISNINVSDLTSLSFYQAYSGTSDIFCPSYYNGKLIIINYTRNSILDTDLDVTVVRYLLQSKANNKVYNMINNDINYLNTTTIDENLFINSGVVTISQLTETSVVNLGDFKILRYSNDSAYSKNTYTLLGNYKQPMYKLIPNSKLLMYTDDTTKSKVFTNAKTTENYKPYDKLGDNFEIHAYK